MAGQAKGSRTRRSGGGSAAAKPKTQTAAPLVKGKLIIDGAEYELGDLDLGELEELEEHVDKPLDEISFGSIKAIAFVVYLVRRRDEPDFTLDDARKIKVTALGATQDAVAVEGGGDRPTEGTDEPESPTSS